MPNLKRGILRGLKGARGVRTVYGRGFDPLSPPLQSLELKTFLLVMNECDTSHCVFDRLRKGSMLTKKSALTVQNDCSNSISQSNCTPTHFITPSVQDRDTEEIRSRSETDTVVDIRKIAPRLVLGSFRHPDYVFLEFRSRTSPRNLSLAAVPFFRAEEPAQS